MAVPAAMSKLADGIDRLTRAVGRAAAWLVVAVVLLQFALVVARYAFALGSMKLTEAVIYGHAALIMGPAAWTLAAGGHVRVDIFYGQAGARARAAIDLVGSLLLLFLLKTMIPAFAALMALQGVAQAIRAAAVLSNRAQPMNRELR